jgi:hypothetical protein
VYPENGKDWKNVDRKPDIKAEDLVSEVFKVLRNLDPVVIGANQHFLGEGPAWLHFDTSAQKYFDKWRAKIEIAIRTGDRHPALESHISKYRSLVPALALLFHLIDRGTGPVTLAATKKAINWQLYLYEHARRIYAIVTDRAGHSAKALSEKIIAGKVKDKFTIRGIYRNGWANLSSPDEVSEAVDLLIEKGWLRQGNEETGGRKKNVYYINPKAVKG